MENLKIISLAITDEQELALQAFFAHNDWDWDKAVIEKGDKEKATPTDEPAPPDAAVPMPGEGQGSLCPHCLCEPCITAPHNRQAWWPSHPQEPKPGNSGSCKDCYRKFWAMLSNFGIWRKPAYLSKKAVALGRDPRRKTFVYHRREIMPDCVIKEVRHWFPNEEGKPYMGHMWD